MKFRYINVVDPRLSDQHTPRYESKAAWHRLSCSENEIWAIGSAFFEQQNIQQHMVVVTSKKNKLGVYHDFLSSVNICHRYTTSHEHILYVFDSFGPASGRGRLLCTKLWSVKMTNKPYCWVGFVTISSDIFLVGDASPPSVVRCMCSGRFVHLAPHPPGGASRFEDGEDPSHVWPNM